MAGLAEAPGAADEVEALGSTLHDERIWRVYESYLLALDDEALAGELTPPPSDYWGGSPRSIDSYNNWEPPDEVTVSTAAAGMWRRRDVLPLFGAHWEGGRVKLARASTA